jgi:hypothetical protein
VTLGNEPEHGVRVLNHYSPGAIGREMVCSLRGVPAL